MNRCILPSSKICLVWMWLALLAGLHSFCGVCQAQSDRPNIVYILADDMGYGDVHALNPECKIATPHLDALTSAGMYFSDAHSSSSVCTPTRYGVLTGRYNWRSRLKSGVLGGFSRKLIEPERTTVASMLKGRGYYTGCIGKWHLGMDWPLKAGGYADSGNSGGWDIDYQQPIAGGPLTVGFDEFFGISASLDMPPYAYIRNDRVTTVPTVETKAFGRLGPGADGLTPEDVLPDLTREAVAFITKQAQSSEQPFFLYFPLPAPHTPIAPTDRWKGKSGINKYADFVMQVDWTVGQVLQALEETQQAENTLVIFTSDNGCSPAAKIDELHDKGHRPNDRFRGHKADIFDGGHRVPFLCRWPARISAGTSSNQLVCLTDLMATCAEIVGVELPDGAGEDSVSILPALVGQDDQPLREAVVHHSIRGAFSIRQAQWKLELCPGSGGWSPPRPGRDDMSGLPLVQLYDMENDVEETTNVYRQHPGVVERLTALLQSYVDRGRSTPGAEQQNNGAVDIQLGQQVKSPPKKKAKSEKKPKTSAKNDRQSRAHVVLVVGTHHYSPQETMPVFAKQLEKEGFQTTVILPPGDPEQNKNDVGLPGLEVLKTADVAVFFMRFLALPDDQMQHLLDYVQAGKPVVGLRTSTHAFLYPKGHPQYSWNDGFGRDVLGSKYFIHLQGKTEVNVIEEQRDSPVLAGIPQAFTAAGTLYKAELPQDATPLLMGTGKTTKVGSVTNRFGTHSLKATNSWAVAWTWKNQWGGKVFATTLGHPDSMQLEPVSHLITNGIRWCVE